MKGILPLLILTLVSVAQARLLETEQEMERRYGRVAFRAANPDSNGVMQVEEVLYRSGPLHVNAWFGAPGQVARAWVPGRPIIAELGGRVMRERVTNFEGKLEAAFVVEFLSGYNTKWGHQGKDGWVEIDIPSYFACIGEPQPGCIVYSELVSGDGKYRAYLSATRVEIEFRDIGRRR